MTKPRANKPGGKAEKPEPEPKKRVPLPRKSDFTKEFEKAWNRYVKAGRFDMAEVRNLMTLLINNDGPLPAQYEDHPLKGDYKGFRDCHIHGDHLIIYKLSADDKEVTFVDMGTHSELFK